MKLIQTLRAIGVRRRAVKYANWLTVNHANMPYEEARPFHFPVVFMTRLPAPVDCSASASQILGAAGCPTPWVKPDGYGYTGTMLSQLPHIRKDQSRRGDLVVFGAGTGKHVVMLLQGGRWVSDPTVWSHGRPGIDVMPLSHMQAGFPGDPVTFLRSVPERL